VGLDHSTRIFDLLLVAAKPVHDCLDGCGVATKRGTVQLQEKAIRVCNRPSISGPNPRKRGRLTLELDRAGSATLV
jgi:hypothetical protein